MVLDETAELKKGTRTVGVGRQHAGITGQVENCQTVVFAAYVTARAHALFDFRLYLPKPGARTGSGGSGRTSRTSVAFTTKPALGTAMITAAAARASRSPGRPPTRSTAAAPSCAKPARRPRRGTCSRSR